MSTSNTTRRRTLKAPTSAAAWGTQEAVVHELPSGKYMTLRPGPCMNRLVREGVIPNPLLGIVVKPDEDGNVKQDIDWRIHEEHKAAVVCAMAQDPPVTMEPLEGAVSYDLIDERDVDYIVSVARDGVADLARFRSE